MIDRTLSNSLAVADIAPQAATKLSDTSHGDNGFGEALAGAHTVHDRRESQAASNSRRDWAQGDHSAERTRGQDRANEVRSDKSRHATDAADDVDEHSFTPAEAPEATNEVDDDVASEAGAADATGSTDDTVAAEAAASLVVAGAPIATDADAVIVPTTTSPAATVATDAIDAAMRLAIDPDGAATPNTAETDATTDVATDAETLLATAQGAEDAETGDVEASPTRSTTSAPVATSGPSPVQLDADVDVEVAAPVVAPTTTQASEQVDAAQSATTTQDTAQVAAATVTDIAEGGDADASAQVVAVASTSVDDDVDTSDADTPATVAAAATDGDEATAVATTASDADADADAHLPGGRANATTHVTNPTALAHVQANAQAQTRLAEKAADEVAGDAPVTAVEPTNTVQGPPLTAAARDAQLATGGRVRDGILNGNLQQRIDHIAEQLATRLRLSQAAGGSHVQLSLRPRELGEVTVQMNVREGVVAATILVDKADTLRTLQTNIEDLKRSLENQGLAIQEFSVDVRGDAGAGGANARAAADLRSNATRTSSGSAASLAGAAAVIPGLSGDREVDPDALHDGDVSVLA